jgi:amino acid transporter
MKKQSITSLPVSDEVERRNRMIKYLIAMAVRVVCIVLLLFVQGWWLVLCAIGAIVLPYFAVVIANVKIAPRGGEVLRPGGVEIYRNDDGAK